MELNEKMTPELAMHYYARGLDCSQVVFGHCARDVGVDETQAVKIGGAFGGGMWRGDTCGCVTGALMALSAVYGHEADDPEAKKKLVEKVKEFERRWKAEDIINGTTICRDIIGFDFSQEGEFEKASKDGVMTRVCPQLAATACRIVDEILDEE